jgi:hypothetical protein
MVEKMKNGGLVEIFTWKLLIMKWKDKKDVTLVSIIYD